MASITIVSTTHNSITAKVTGLNTGYNYADRVCYWSVDGVSKGTSTLGANVSSGGSKTFSGLSPSTTYTISCTIDSANWSIDPVALSNVSATTKAAPIALWTWTGSNGAASAAQTMDAYDAITNHGALSDFSYLVWRKV